MSHSIAELSVPADHPALPGHFPGQPIVPGVVLLALVHDQARSQLGFGDGPSRWQRLKFLRPICPDERFRILIDGDADAFRFQIETATGAAVARGQCRHAGLA